MLPLLPDMPLNKMRSKTKVTEGQCYTRGVYWKSETANASLEDEEMGLGDLL
jgi:hypothetical protein